MQPWEFVVIRNRETLTRLAACGQYASHLRGAAVGIVVVTHAGWIGTFDAGRAVQDMMLAAWAEGIGSCIASLQNADCARGLLGIPAGRQVVGISFGYPQPDAPQTIEGRPREEVLASIGRRLLNEMVHWEKW